MSNFFHENHTSSHHQEAQNGIKALSSQSKENKREKTLSACHSNSAFRCTLLRIISFLIEQLVPDKSLVFSPPSILQLLFANTEELQSLMAESHSSLGCTTSYISLAFSAVDICNLTQVIPRIFVFPACQTAVLQRLGYRL